MADTPNTVEITDAASAGLSSIGVVIDSLTLKDAGRRKVLRVFVARDLSPLPDDDYTSTVEPLTLDEVAQATSILNDVLDEPGMMGEQPYTLEVSSVGVGTALTSPEHFRRNVGRLVQITHSDGAESTGRLLAAGPQGIRWAPNDDHWLTYQEINRAMVQVEFNRGTTGEQS